MTEPTIEQLKQQIKQQQTQIELLEQRLAQSQQTSKNIATTNNYFDEVIQYVPIGIAILQGPEFTFEHINQYFANINNLSIEQHLNQPLAEIMSDTAEQLTPILRQVFNTKQPSEKREFTLTYDNGEQKQLVDFHFPIGENALLSLVLDITERKSMAQAVNRSKNELERNIETLKDTQHQLVQTAKLASIGQLTAGLAHELNQPMSRIFLTAEMIGNLLDKPNQIDTQRIQNLLQRIIRDVHSANGLINHLRIYSRQDVSCIYEPVNLSELIDQLMILFDHQIKILGIDFTLSQQHQQQKLYGDSGQIEQVINNLMSNAIDALKERQIKALSLRTFEEGAFTCIEVKDSGCGMSKSVINNMFDPFFTTKESGKGTGLGLSISKGIVENHDGIFSVDSREDEGTTIKVSLPRKRL